MGKNVSPIEVDGSALKVEVGGKSGRCARPAETGHA